MDLTPYSLGRENGFYSLKTATSDITLLARYGKVFLLFYGPKVELSLKLRETKIKLCGPGEQ